MSNYLEFKKAEVKELAACAVSLGLRAFIAKSGTYGFITNNEGTRVVCFEHEFSVFVFSGNYKTDNPATTGTGWRIENAQNQSTLELQILYCINANAPYWAIRGANSVSYTTLNQHLAAYQKSSKYKEFKVK